MTTPAGTRDPLNAGLGTVGTTLRFFLLILLLLAATASMVGPVWVRTSNSDELGCLLAAGADPSGTTLSTQSALILNAEPFQACITRWGVITPWWQLAVPTAAIALAAVVLFFSLPAWKSRRGRAVPVGESDHDEELQRLLSDLAARAGVRNVRFTVDPAVATTGAVAFGRPGRYVVRLHGGLVARRHTDPDGFHAVILHELAHVRSGDVRLAYMTTALWRIFLVAVLLPYVALSARTLFSGLVFGPSSLFWVGVVPILSRRIVLSLVLTAMLTLARADLLRHRELHADLTAVHWGASQSVWSRRAYGDHPRRWWRLFIDPWRTHPRWEQRVRSLGNPEALAGSFALPMLLTGIAALITVASLPALLEVLRLPQVAVDPVAIFSVAGLVAGIAVLALGPAVAHALTTGRKAPSGLWAGLWLGTGLVIGELVLDRIEKTMWLPTRPAVLLFLPAMAAVTCWWATECIKLWLRHRSGRLFRPVLLVGLPTWVVVAGWLSWWEHTGYRLISGWEIPPSLMLRWLLSDGPEPGGGIPLVVAVVLPVLNSFANEPLWLALGALIWLCPLLALLRRPDPEEDRPSLPRLVTAALVGAALSWAAIAGAMAYIHPLRPTSAQMGPWVYLSLVFVALTAGGALAAMVVAATARHYRLITALVTVGISSLAALGGVLLIESFDGCLGSLNVFTDVCRWKPGLASAVVGAEVPFVLSTATPSAVLMALIVGSFGSRFRTADVWTLRGGGGLAPRLTAGLLLATAPVFLLWFSYSPRDTVTLHQDQAFTLLANKNIAESYVRTSASPRIRANQIFAWMKYGGRDICERFISDIVALTATMKAGVKSGDEDWWRSENVKARLRSLLADADKADRYFTIPDRREQQIWAGLVTGTKRNVSDWLDAVGRGDRKAAMSKMDQAAASLQSFGPLVERLIRATDDALSLKIHE